MGGDITYSSLPGQGTTFACRLVLPASSLERDFEEEEAEQERKHKSSEDTAESILELKGMRVLLVDDNAISQKVGTRLLTRLGVDVKVSLLCASPPH